MKRPIPRRELADHGGFEAKPTDRRWHFWPRTSHRGDRAFVPVITSGSSWIIARELAVLELARTGVIVAAQDLESMPAVSELNGAAAH